MSDQEQAANGVETLSVDDLQDSERAAFQVMTEICEAMEMDIRPRVTGLQKPYMEIDLEGEDAAATFGRHGKMLDALQYLSNLVISRKTGADIRVLLDADDYRARRIQTLTDLAHEFANMVKERQEECELDPLPAHERRIIHAVLADDPDIKTYSEGDEPDRRVIISPR